MKKVIEGWVRKNQSIDEIFDFNYEGKMSNRDDGWHTQVYKEMNTSDMKKVRITIEVDYE